LVGTSLFVAPTPASALAGTVAERAVTISGSLPASMTGAEGAVFAQPALSSSHVELNLSRIKDFATDHDRFSVALHSRSLVRFRNVGGFVNLIVVIESASAVYRHGFSVDLNSSSPSGVFGAKTRTAIGSGATVALGTIYPMDILANKVVPDPDHLCQSVGSSATSAESASRIGEMHVADQATDSETYEYHNSLNVSVTFAQSTTFEDGLTTAGSLTVSHSESTDAKMTQDRGYLQYVDSHMYYQWLYYDEPGGCVNPYYQYQAVREQGDVFGGDNQPSGLGHSCRTQSYVTISGAPGSWASDRGTAWTYAASVMYGGYTFGAVVGFTSDITDEYDIGTPGNAQTTYVCGKGGADPTSASILYNTAT
jgi:hypothetical protein